MSTEPGSGLLRTALMALWGMATLVLFFSVILLAYEMIRRGQNPLELSFDSPTSTAAQKDDTQPKTTREILLYFANAQGTALAPERRRIEWGDHTAENARKALEALIEGPRDILVPVLSPASEIRGAYLLDGGELILDFSRDLEAGQIKSAAAELLMVQGIVASLTQPALRGQGAAAVKKVRFLFEGSPPQDTFPAHIDLSQPVSPQRSWILAGAERGDDG